MSAYTYSQNNPITLSDPDGKRPMGAGDTACSNCRTTTNKKTGKASWKFGNEKDGSRSVWGKRSKSIKYSGGRNYRPSKRIVKGLYAMARSKLTDRSRQCSYGACSSGRPVHKTKPNRPTQSQTFPRAEQWMGTGIEFLSWRD